MCIVDFNVLNVKIMGICADFLSLSSLDKDKGTIKNNKSLKTFFPN